MKLVNSTVFPDRFLRRLVSWCCGQIELGVRELRLAEFTNCSGHYRGLASNSRRILCRVGPAENFPMEPDGREGMDNEVIADRIEALVAITAHELAHIGQFVSGRMSRLKKQRRTEPATRREEVRVLRSFRLQRESLLAQWSAPAKPKPVLSIQDKRAAKALADLERWQRKLKLAQTKVRKAKRRAAYYEKVLAAKRSV